MQILTKISCSMLFFYNIMWNKKLLPISNNLVKEVKDANNSNELYSNRNINTMFKVTFY